MRCTRVALYDITSDSFDEVIGEAKTGMVPLFPRKPRLRVLRGGPDRQDHFPVPQHVGNPGAGRRGQRKGRGLGQGQWSGPVRPPR